MKNHKPLILTFLVFLALLAGCRAKTEGASLNEPLRARLAEAGITYTSLAPGPPADQAKITLGQMLFFDKELGGSRDTSCATCHHPLMHTSDGLSLPIGVGGQGLGAGRVRGNGRELVPRNSPEVFNRGAPEWVTMFWDGRISGSPEMGYANPAGMMLPHGLDNVLAVQAMFPPTSHSEMRGLPGDVDVFGEVNELAIFPDDDPAGVWQALMARLLAIPEYVRLFRAAYPEVSADELGFQHAANAIAAYEAATWTFDDSPWDAYLAGDDSALSNAEKRGALLFYGEARCAVCHAGNLLTDQGYHNIGVPQLGPGKDDELPLDFGRWHVTNNPEDKFAFRTPPLRNVALTGPWMHNGAYTSLEAALRHHLDAAAALQGYDPAQLAPGLEETCQEDDGTIQSILQTLDPLILDPIELSEAQIADLLAFLNALTSPSAIDLREAIPNAVPSGLPVRD